MSTFATDIKNGDGSTVVFTLSFPFLSRDDVTVSRLEDTEPDTATGTVLTVIQTGIPTGDEFRWQDNSTIQVGTSPTANQKLRFKRTTPDSAQVVQWDDGSYLVATDLNTADLQFLYLIQELDDRVQIDEAGAVGEAPNNGIQYGRQSKEWTPTLPDAPNDGKEYTRQSQTWTEITGFPEAPQDSKLYGRENAGWKEVPPPGISDAPVDNKEYARLNGSWVEIPEDQTGVPEAPIGTGKIYGRKDASWVQVESGGGGGGLDYKGTRDLSLAAPSNPADGDFYVNTAATGVVDSSWSGLGGTALTGGERVAFNGLTWDMIPSPASGLQSVVAGNDISVNNADPANPVVSVTPNSFLTSITAGLNITVDGSTVGVTPASFLPYNISILPSLP